MATVAESPTSVIAEMWQTLMSPRTTPVRLPTTHNNATLSWVLPITPETTIDEDDDEEKQDHATPLLASPPMTPAWTPLTKSQRRPALSDSARSLKMKALVRQGLLEDGAVCHPAAPPQPKPQPKPQQSCSGKCAVVPLFVFALWVPKLALALVALCFAVAGLFSSFSRPQRPASPAADKQQLRTDTPADLL